MVITETRVREGPVILGLKVTVCVAPGRAAQAGMKTLPLLTAPPPHLLGVSPRVGLSNCGPKGRSHTTETRVRGGERGDWPVSRLEC